MSLHQHLLWCNRSSSVGWSSQDSDSSHVGAHISCLCSVGQVMPGMCGPQSSSKELSPLSWRCYLQVPGWTSTHPTQMAHATTPMAYHDPLSPSNISQSHSHRDPENTGDLGREPAAELFEAVKPGKEETVQPAPPNQAPRNRDKHYTEV